MREYVRLRRYPFAPLAEAVGVVYNPQPSTNQYGTRDSEVWVRNHGNPVGILSELTGIGRRRLTRWTVAGVPEDEADRVACALGLHVSAIWPDEWFGPYGVSI